MKRKSAWLTYTACALTAAATIAPLQTVSAEDKEKIQILSPAPIQDFSNVQVISLSDGTIGFFEKSTGRIFVYGGQLGGCLYVLQVTKLGEPIKIIEGHPVNLTLPKAK